MTHLFTSLPRITPSVFGIAFAAFALVLPAKAITAFVDFGDGSTVAKVGSDVYNVVVNPAGTTTTNHPLATEGVLNLDDLQDLLGDPTTIDVSLSSYNNGGGQLRGGQGIAGNLGHDPVAGIEESASGDSFWINNHNSNGIGAGNEFGFIITFSDLTEPFYNITLLAGSNNHGGSWAVTTGTGDGDSVPFGTALEDVLTWTNVSPVGGIITLTGTSVPTISNFQNTTVSFVSIESVSATGLSDPEILAPSLADFEIVPSPPGTATEVASIRNLGSSNNLEISSVVVSGPNAANFSVISHPSSLAPGEFGEIQLSFDALGMTGDLSASLTVMSNDPDDGSVVIPLTATVDPDGDSDDDGRSDADEETDGTDPLNPDSDGDSLSDGDEASLMTNPLLADSDGDGFSDPEEIAFSSDPNDADADGDSDNLTDAEEFAAGTNPGDSDTDGDDLNDGEELASVPPTNPLSADTDSDGLSDSEEIEDYQTDPTVADSDGDGVSDGDEISLSTNPLDGDDPVVGGLATTFRTGFEYSGGAPLVGTEAVNLDGADDQIGSWAGTVPAAIVGEGGAEFFSFQDVAGDQFLLADRPGETASFDAVFTDPVTLDLGRVHFDVGVRRTVGDQRKDLEIVGLDSLGQESFHLVISAASTGGRVGVRIPDDGGMAIFDLPTTIGEDSSGDLPFFSGTQEGGFGKLAIALAADGYVLTFSKDDVLYVTEKLAFNGAPADLSRIRFTVPGSPSDGNDRGGLWLNDIEARGIATLPATDGPQVTSITFDQMSRSSSIRFSSKPSAVYTVWTSVNLIDWQELNDSVNSEGTETEFIEPGIPATEPKRFYRFSENP